MCLIIPVAMRLCCCYFDAALPRWVHFILRKTRHVEQSTLNIFSVASHLLSLSIFNNKFLQLYAFQYMLQARYSRVFKICQFPPGGCVLPAEERICRENWPRFGVVTFRYTIECCNTEPVLQCEVYAATNLLKGVWFCKKWSNQTCSRACNLARKTKGQFKEWKIS